MDRIWDALMMTVRHWHALARYNLDVTLQCKSIVELDLHLLKKQGIKILVLDFDGVLASHGEVELSPDIVGWLNNSLQIFSKGEIFVLSNHASVLRAQYFSTHFPDVHFIFPEKKKPYPDGILQILKLTGIEPKALLMIDDRLLTGILAATLANVSALLVTTPMIAFNKRPLQESFYMALRKLERLIL